MSDGTIERWNTETFSKVNAVTFVPLRSINTSVRGPRWITSVVIWTASLVSKLTRIKFGNQTKARKRVTSAYSIWDSLGLLLKTATFLFGTQAARHY